MPLPLRLNKKAASISVTHKCDTCGIHSSICNVGCLSCNRNIRLCKRCMDKYLTQPLRKEIHMAQLCIKCQRDKQIDICLM